MASSFIAPKTAAAWVVDVEELDRFVSARWPGVERSGEGTGQQAHLWTLPGFSEVWVPEHLDVVWMDATTEELAAVGVWCASMTSVPLILSDEGYDDPIDLFGRDEASVLDVLDAS